MNKENGRRRRMRRRKKNGKKSGDGEGNGKGSICGRWRGCSGKGVGRRGKGGEKKAYTERRWQACRRRVTRRRFEGGTEGIMEKLLV